MTCVIYVDMGRLSIIKPFVLADRRWSAVAGDLTSVAPSPRRRLILYALSVVLNLAVRVNHVTCTRRVCGLL